MGGQARTKQNTVPELPREVLQHIFSMTEPDDDYELVLPLKDRVRALAVCRAWKAGLDFKLCPIAALGLDGDQEADRRIATWIARTQPAVESLTLEDFNSHQMLLTLLSVTPRPALVELFLYGDGRMLQDSLAAVRLFPRLKVLSLQDASDRVRVGRLDLAVLEPLSALERLHLRQWESVELKSAAVLPQLSSLCICSVGSTEIDAALPSLTDLYVHSTEILRLRGPHLQLPQLSQLSLRTVRLAAVSWPALPQLSSLAAVECRQITIGALSKLGRLASLTLGWSRECWEAGGRMLHAAPPSLHHLCFDGSKNEWSQAPLLSSVAQLTSLRCNSPAIIPYLGPLMQLQELVLGQHSAADVTMEHSGWLCGLSSLRLLRFGRELDCRDSGTGRLKQVLAKLLPAGCMIAL